ncbi:MAG: helix-turn-helix domain-containing protein [Candidatus Korobacteraceae bacterium]
MAELSAVPCIGPRPVIEPYVDADTAADFLAVKKATLLDRARRGEVPAHPWGDGTRRMWRFRLSELESWINQQINKAKREPVEHRRRSAKAA